MIAGRILISACKLQQVFFFSGPAEPARPGQLLPARYCVGDIPNLRLKRRVK